MELKDIKLKPLLETLKLTKISDEVYFSDEYKHYVSNSRLGLINPKQEGSPDKFFNGFTSTYSSAFALGSAVHELVLQPEYFELAEDTGKPTAKLGVMADELYKVFLERNVTKDDVVYASNKVDYFKGKINDDRFNDIIQKCTPYWNNRRNYKESDKEIIFLDYRSLEIVKSCVDALLTNKHVTDLLHPEGIDPISVNEQAILLDVEVTCPNGKNFIIPLKSKLDNFTIDLNDVVVNDVKTIGKIVSEIDNNITKFHYSREFAMYIYLLRFCSQKFYNVVEPNIKANYLVVSTIPNFYSKVRPVTLAEIAQGFTEFQSLLKYVAYCIGYKGYQL